VTLFSPVPPGEAIFFEKQRSNLRRVLGALAADTIVAPGHGPITTVGTEIRYNPFLS
jgi:glyoxylase-like metal-dependent hydrolase (beta-lactamase superfamily II)